MELQDVDKNTGINSNLCKDVCRLLKCMVTATWINAHTCGLKFECSYCEYSVMWHQLSVQLIAYLSPKNLAHPPDVSNILVFLLFLVFYKLLKIPVKGLS